VGDSMKRTLFAIGVACLAILGVVIARRHFADSKITAKLSPQARGDVRHNAILDAYGKLPLSFEQNSGQTDPRVRFLAHGSGYTLFLTDQEATLRLDLVEKVGTNPLERPTVPDSSKKTRSVTVRFALAQSNPHPKVHGLDMQPGHSNYFVGNNPAKWHRNVPQFAQVKYDGVYPGVDLVYYGNQGRLESDYIVAPGADAQQIAIRVDGADNLKVNSSGDAIITTAVGEVSLHQPHAYQESHGARQEIAANYVQRGPGLVGIQVGTFDSRQTLVIDPVVGYATFLSGSTGATFGNGIALDSTGDAVVVGSTSATNFPVTSGAFQTASNNPSDSQGYIAKLNGNGTALIFATYLGGSGKSGQGDVTDGVAVDASGNVYVAGVTVSTDFPITSGGLQIINKNTFSSGYLTKLDPTGSTLLYSTYLGGSVGDASYAVALDSNANAYVTGFTSSSDFPTTPGTAIQTTTAGTPKAYVTRINTTLSGSASLVYSTLLGGSVSDIGHGIAVDANFNAYITGQTKSPDYPTTASAFQAAMKGTAGNGFISEIDTTTANHLVYSTYLGGTATNNPGQTGVGDSGAGIALDQNFNAYVIGSTESADFPVTPGAFQTVPKNTHGTVVVARLNTTKSGANSLIYSTFLSGSLFDVPGGIAVDSVGNSYLVGTTDSSDFPTVPGGPQPTRSSFNRNIIFVSVLDPTGAFLPFSTYFGGNNGDDGSAIALDSPTTPNLYFTGLTASSDFPVTPGAFQTAFKTGGAYVVKLSPAAAVGVFTAPTSVNFGNQTINTSSPAQTVQLANLTTNTLTISGISFTGTNSTDFTQGVSTCGTTLAVRANCTIGIIFKPTTAAGETALLNITDSDSSSPQTVPLTGTGTPVPSLISLTPVTLTFTNQNITTTSTAQTATLTNNSTSALTGIAITITGASASSFAQTTTCGTTLAVGANCGINVTFTPAVTGAATATLSVADSDPSSPQTVALSGTGITNTPDFGIAVSPASTSVAAGTTAAYTVTITSLNGYTTPVALSCTGAPVDSTCMLAPAMVTPTTGGATSSGSVLTAVRTMVVPPVSSFRAVPRFPTAIWPTIFALIFISAWIVRRQPTSRRLAWTFAVLLALSQTSCSGVPHTGTPAGTYTLTITGTSGSLTHQITVMLTVT
jgi:Cep192 domain 4/Beta-propeller repeat